MATEPPRIEGPKSGGAVPPALRDACLAALNAHPYFVVLSGMDPVDDPTFVQTLVGMMTTVEADREAMTLSRIEVDPTKVAKPGTTSFSRTSDALEAHTDSTFMDRPHEVVAFQFARAAAEGGDSIVIPLDEMLARLPEGVAEAAAAARLPFADKLHPLITSAGAARSIRFYRTQIESSAKTPLTDDERALIKAMGEAGDADHGDYRFHAASGETLLINNTKCLHSRTSFAPDSDRLMFRIRCHSDLVG